MIRIKNFSKSYRSVQVYKNFNLDINAGEITCVLGESGCGKTTLLNAVAGLISYEGEITPVKCSYVFQTPRLIPNLTVLDNLKLVCGDEEKIKTLLKRTRMDLKAGAYPNSLSGGQAQRVSLIRAFLFGSEAILLDEAFSSLDLKLKYDIYKLFSELWEEDKRTAVFVTHDVDEALALAQRIIIIKDGNAVFDKKLDGNIPRNYEDFQEERKELISRLIFA